MPGGRRRRSSDGASGYKFDLFPLTADPFQRSEFRRRCVQETPQFGGRLELAVATTQDTIPANLAWQEAGDRIPVPNWNDGLAVQGAPPELDYLWHCALHRRIEPLLESPSMQESGVLAG